MWGGGGGGGGGEWSLKIKERASSDIVSKLAASFKNVLTGSSSGECQTVARVRLGPEVDAMLLKTPSQAAPVAIKKLLEMKCCLTKCSEKN